FASSKPLSFAKHSADLLPIESAFVCRHRAGKERISRSSTLSALQNSELAKVSIRKPASLIPVRDSESVLLSSSFESRAASDRSVPFAVQRLCPLATTV